MPPGQMKSMPRSLQKQLGAFTLVELIAVLMITAILSIYAMVDVVQKADDQAANATGAYLTAATTGAQRYALLNFDALKVTTPTLVGFANPLAPTVDELKAAGYLATGFRAFTSSNQQIRFDLFRTGCPGSACSIVSMACLTDAFKLHGRVREDLATVAMLSMNGQGGRSQLENGSVVRGNGSFVTTTNPVGNVPGVVCGQDVFDTEIYDRFVRINDTRDPNLQGNLTVAGNIGAGRGTDINGKSCTLGAILSSGEVLSRSASCIKLAWMGNDGAGNGQVGVADASGNTRVLLGGDGTITTKDASGNTMARIGADGTATVKGLTLNKDVVLGTACAPEEGAAWATNGNTSAGPKRAIATCFNGKWVDAGGLPGAAVNNTCSVNGAIAQDSNGVQLICSNGIWMSTRERMGHFTMQGTYLMTDSAMLAKPSCPNGKAFVNAMRKSEGQLQFQYVNLSYTDLGSSWQFFFRDQDGAVIQGDFVVQDYCYFP